MNKERSHVSSYQIPLVRGVAPVKRAVVPGKESLGCEHITLLYKIPFRSMRAMLEVGFKETYVVKSAYVIFADE